MVAGTETRKELLKRLARLGRFIESGEWTFAIIDAKGLVADLETVKEVSRQGAQV